MIIEVGGVHLGECLPDVTPQTLGGFIGDLGTVLQHSNGEEGGRHGGEEEPVVPVDLGGGLRVCLHYRLQTQHPTLSQVAIL